MQRKNEDSCPESDNSENRIAVKAGKQYKLGEQLKASEPKPKESIRQKQTKKKSKLATNRVEFNSESSDFGDFPF